ncbi:MAG TPA: sugar ABC transporter substrate-binding protein [Vicinamibacteria bacterium]|nr:sugar ABC transporter substrate-binding protein [Vicinamibacteria bacterium]
MTRYKERVMKTRNAVAAALLLTLWACSGPRSDRPRIALVMKSLANEFFKTMEDGARAHQRAHAAEYDLLATGIKDEQDVAGQIRLVEQMIAEGVNALVIAPADSQALVAVCKKAKDAGIQVVNIDNKLDDIVLSQRRLSVPFVGPNNRKGAFQVGAYLAQGLKPGDKVAILEGVPGAYNAVERRIGFEGALTRVGIVIASSQPAHWETARANQVAAALLTEIPNLKAILCANDSMALGAVAAIKAAGREGQVQVVGFDNISAVRELVKSGRILATADQHADQLAVFGIEYALEMLKTKGVPASRETPVDLITAETLK